MSHMSSDLMFCQKDIVNLHIVCVHSCHCMCVFVRERDREEENAFCLLLLLLIIYCAMIFLDHKNQVCHRLLGATSWGTIAWRGTGRLVWGGGRWSPLPFGPFLPLISGVNTGCVLEENKRIKPLILKLSLGTYAILSRNWNEYCSSCLNSLKDHSAVLFQD